MPSGSSRQGWLKTTKDLRFSPLLGEFAATDPEVRLAGISGTVAGLPGDVVDAGMDGALLAGPVAHRDEVSGSDPLTASGHPPPS